jgi:hypothetical protein
MVAKLFAVARRGLMARRAIREPDPARARRRQVAGRNAPAVAVVVMVFVLVVLVIAVGPIGMSVRDDAAARREGRSH